MLAQRLAPDVQHLPARVEQAAAWGLAVAAGADPGAAALEYFTRHLAGKSAASVRYALRAARLLRIEAIRAGLAAVEKLYLQGLMNTRDANEGLTAFLARRPPVWEHH